MRCYRIATVVRFGSSCWSGDYLGAVRFSFDFRADTGSQRPVYLQLADLVIREIEAGRIAPGARVPGTRKLAKTLSLNRNTVVAAYQDVEQQGYLSARPGAGYYVSEALPLRPSVGETEASDASGANFSFRRITSHATEPASPALLRITEGAPDVRLADLRPLYATARQLLQRPAGKQLLRYGEGRGDHRLRSALSYYLNVSRGIPTEPDRLLITRGSQHAFQLACTLLFAGGGVLAVAELTYGGITQLAEQLGVEVIRVPLDADGLDVGTLAAHPRLAEVRAVYVTPHHQYPTTVTLTAERRIQLLELARTHHFAILEDDYDYDFYYERAPQLPLAALDRGAQVIYIGSFTKVLAPNLRIGYMYGPADFLDAVLALRLRSDRQGDLLLERAMAYYLKNGEVDRHLRKVRPVYQQRRDLLTVLLQDTFGDRISFTPPRGGMATWVEFAPEENYEGRLANLREVWVSPSWRDWRQRRGLRIGFASLDDYELRNAVEILGKLRGGLESRPA